MNRYTCMKFQGQATAEASSPIWASGEAARGQGEESLQRSLINFHLLFAQTNVKWNTIGWKKDVPEIKLDW